MFGHLPELFLIMVIALIVFGPEKLPEVAAQAGKWVREAREVIDSAMTPHETHQPDDFSAYYYDSLARSTEDASAVEDPDDFMGYPPIEVEEPPMEGPEPEIYHEAQDMQGGRAHDAGAHSVRPGGASVESDAGTSH